MMLPMNPEQPQNSEPANAPARRAPCWNIVSVAIPALAIAVGFLVLIANPSGRGDFGGAMGAGILFILGVCAACGLGAIAAVIALVREERMQWLTVIGLLGNGAVLVPVLWLMLRD